MGSDIARWEPMRELGALRDEMERIVRQTFGSQPEDTALIGAWSPALDVEETEPAFEIHLEAPGVEPEDIDITLEEGVLTVSGERKSRRLREGRGDLRRRHAHRQGAKDRSRQTTQDRGDVGLTRPASHPSRETEKSP